MSTDYDGIKIRGPIKDDAMDSAPAVGGQTITWFQVPAAFLGGPVEGTAIHGPGSTPAELIELWFGNDLHYATDGWSSIYMTSPAEDVYGGLAAWQAWRSTVTIAYMVTAVIGNLPPISTDDWGVAGFLDSDKPWGLVYDADVLHKNQRLTDMLGISPGASAAAINEHLSTLMSTRDWMIAGASDTGHGDEFDESSIYPAGAYADLLAWYDDPDTFVRALTATAVGTADPLLAPAPALTGFGSDNNRPMTYATYGLEAIGYDAYDKSGLIPGVGPDAGEALHNNEIYRFAPPGASEEVMHAPARAKADDMEGFYQINWTYPPELHETFAGAYHAERDDVDWYTYADSDNTWKKTHDQEIIDMNSTIDEVCRIIGPTLETTEFPKRFINHIQRKRKIPNNLVSAFGYVPEEMYTVGATDTYTFGAGDKISYDPVTGEPMDMDATWGYASSATTWEGEARGADASRYTNVEGWADDGTGGAGESDTGTDRPDGVDATRYEGWDD